jgi:FkbM family methyltransferase
MNNKIKNILKRFVSQIATMIIKIPAADFFIDEIILKRLEIFSIANHNEVSIKLYTPNRLCLERARTFSSKEPETLDWIDSFPNNSCLWDIGANIGLYSLYAAKKKSIKVIAFEPLSTNIQILAKNIYANDLVDKVVIFPLPLTNSSGMSIMRDSMNTWGGSQASFNANIGWDGKSISSKLDFQTYGLSIDDAIDKLLLPKPDFIKLDVDGIEHIILNGGLKALVSVQSILIEINDSFIEQSSKCELIMNNSGFFLDKKTRSEMFCNGSVYNQIWRKK